MAIFEPDHRQSACSLMRQPMQKSPGCALDRETNLAPELDKIRPGECGSDAVVVPRRTTPEIPSLVQWQSVLKIREHMK